MNQNLDKTEKSILDALNEFAKIYWEKKEKGEEQEGITMQIFEKLGYLAPKGYGVCSKHPDHEAEWLYDMVWFKNDAKNEHLVKVDLVLESELNHELGALKYDFEKILISNAPYKIFICTSNPTEQISFFEKCVKANQNLKVGDKVTLFIWDDYGNGDFIPHQIIKQ